MTTKVAFPTLLFLISTLSASGQVGTDNHTVTVRVQEITAIEIDVGSVSMTIDGSGLSAGQDTMTVSDQSTSMFWGTNAQSIKTTIATSLLTPRFAMRASAVNATAGTPAGDIWLSVTPADFLIDIGQSTGSCQILYTS